MAHRKNAEYTLKEAHYNADKQSNAADEIAVEGFYYTLDDAYPGNTPVPVPPMSNVHPIHPPLTQAFIFADYAVRTIIPLVLPAVELSTVAAKLKKLPEVNSEQTCVTAQNALRDVQKRLNEVREEKGAQLPELPPMDAALSFDPAETAVHMEKWQETVREVYAKHSAEAAVFDNLATNVGQVLTYADRACTGALQAARAKKKTDVREGAYGTGMEVGHVVQYAAEIDPDAVWDVVNEMLQAL